MEKKKKTKTATRFENIHGNLCFKPLEAKSPYTVIIIIYPGFGVKIINFHVFIFSRKHVAIRRLLDFNKPYRPNRDRGSFGIVRKSLDCDDVMTSDGRTCTGATGIAAGAVADDPAGIISFFIDVGAETRNIRGRDV